MRLRRRFSIRLALGIFGVLFFVVAPFIGVGWVLAYHQEWLYRTLGNQKTRGLWDWYLNAAARVLPGDQDDDGWRDGVELMLRSDMFNARSHRLDSANLVESPSCVCLRGERTSLRWVMKTMGGFKVPYPRGFQVMAWTDAPVLLPKNGTGDPTCGPLLLIANERGELECDVVISDDYNPWRANSESRARVEFYGVVKGVTLDGGVYPVPGWRHPAREVTFTDERGAPLTQPPDPGTRLPKERVCIAYPEGEAEGYLVEARRKTPGGPWERKAWKARPWMGERHPCMDLGDAAAWQPQDRLGDFEFRLVPVLETRPLLQ